VVAPGEPAEHLAKAEEFLGAVLALLRAGLPERAVAEGYYAAFHAAQALLATAGMRAETYAGVHGLLARHFVRDGPLPEELSRDFSHLMSDRLLADYGVDGQIGARTARRSIELALGVLRPILEVVAQRGVGAAEIEAARMRLGEVEAILAATPR